MKCEFEDCNCSGVGQLCHRKKKLMIDKAKGTAAKLIMKKTSNKKNTSE